MRKSVKLNGTIKVGLGQSKSGKILDRDTKCVHFYTSHEDEKEQIRKLMVARAWHNESGKPMFYSHNSRAYQKITIDWINNRIEKLMDECKKV